MLENFYSEEIYFIVRNGSTKVIPLGKTDYRTMDAIHREINLMELNIESYLFEEYTGD